ncbi:darcynin family protein [Martelella lutilitoris]|nr:darcynin family protein [Martelella lutilitoris]
MHKFTIFMLLTATPAWLRLSRPERNRIAGETLTGALAGLDVTHQHFDAEAFCGVCSDVAVFETDDLGAYYCVIERLRDTAIFREPYFEVVQIIPAIGDGFRQFEDREAPYAA